MTVRPAGGYPAPHPYPTLFSPATVGPLRLQNRVIMGSMHLGLEDRRRDALKLAAFYAERARGGAGLIITGGFAPNRTGRPTPGVGTMRAAADVRAHRTVTDAVHAAGGRIALQLLHTGRYSFHPWPSAPGRSKSPHHPVHGPAAVDPCGGAHRGGLRARGRAGPAGRLRRDRGDGLGGVSHQPVPLPADERAYR